MTRDELISQIEEHGLTAYRDILLDMAQECVGLTSTRDKSNPPAIGASKLGGNPDLPADVPWPESDDCNLYFMAQFKLSELPPAATGMGLPPTGMLYFFYDMHNMPWGFDPKDKSGHRVLFIEEESGLASRVAPEAIEFDDGVLECSLTPEVTYSLPSDPPFEVSQDPDESAWDRCFDLQVALSSGHQLLGRPCEVQNPMELECQLASNGVYCGDGSASRDPRYKDLEPGAADWRLLFQFDSDDDTGVMWGDMGTIYYWIREQDLAARRFDRTWLVLQCH